MMLRTRSMRSLDESEGFWERKSNTSIRIHCWTSSN